MRESVFLQHTFPWVISKHASLESQAGLFYEKKHSLRHTPGKLSNSPDACLGNLSALPVEILHLILEHSDLQSLSTWRCVNRYWLSVVESLPAYKFIQEYASKAFRGSLLIKSASFITCSHFYNTILRSICEICGAMAPYIYLVTCMRVCEMCVEGCIDLFPLPVYHATCLFGLGKTAMHSLPHMMPWQGLDENKRRETRNDLLVDYRSALNAGLRRHGSRQAMERYGDQIFPEAETWRGNQRDLCYHPTEHVREARVPYHPRRWLAICGVPIVSHARDEILELRCCKACQQFRRVRRLVYTVVAFAEHLRVFGPIVKGEHVFPEPPIIEA